MASPVLVNLVIARQACDGKSCIGKSFDCKPTMASPVVASLVMAWQACNGKSCCGKSCCGKSCDGEFRTLTDGIHPSLAH